MIGRVLHISNSPYSSLADAGPTLKILRELAVDSEAYHVLAPNVDRRWGVDREGKLVLHLLPNVTSKGFPLTAYVALPLVHRHSIDAIVCQDPFLGGVAGVQIGRLCNVPVMVELHTDLYFNRLTSHRRSDRVIGQLAIRALRQATCIRVSTPSSARLLEKLGINPERMAYVPYRVDTNFFSLIDDERSAAREALRLTDSDRLVVTVGRFVPQKGYGALVKAFSEVARTVDNVRLIIAGGGPQESILFRLVRDLGLEDLVTLRSWLSREEQRSLLAAADLYAQPSLSGLGEWMPRTILEAMAMHLPVVASVVGGISDVVSPEIGVLVTPGDVPSLASALVRLLDNDGRRREMGLRARRDALELYGWELGFRRYRAAVYGMTR